MTLSASGIARRNVALPTSRMVALTARHVDLGDVGARLGFGHLGRLVALATVAALGQMRPVAEVVKCQRRPCATSKRQRLIFLDVTGAAIAEGLADLPDLRRLIRLVRVTGIAFGVMREAGDDLRLIEAVALVAGRRAGAVGHLAFHL